MDGLRRGRADSEDAADRLRVRPPPQRHRPVLRRHRATSRCCIVEISINPATVATVVAPILRQYSAHNVYCDVTENSAKSELFFCLCPRPFYLYLFFAPKHCVFQLTTITLPSQSRNQTLERRRLNSCVFRQAKLSSLKNIFFNFLIKSDNSCFLRTRRFLPLLTSSPIDAQNIAWNSGFAEANRSRWFTTNPFAVDRLVTDIVFKQFCRSPHQNLVHCSGVFSLCFVSQRFKLKHGIASSNIFPRLRL